MSVKRELAALGQATRQLREERGIGRQELAASLGIAPSKLQALEAGRLDPDYHLLLDLADGLGIRLITLVTRWEERINES